MEISQEQKLNAQVVQNAWDDVQFKNQLIANPLETMEKLTGHKINLPAGKKLVVIDQTDESTVYFTIPRKVDMSTLELTEEQLEMVAGGITPTIIPAIGYGICVGILIWAASHQH